MAKVAPQAKFESVLDRPGSEIEPPKNLPVGTYVCVVQGQPRIDKSAKKQTEFSEYTLKILEARDDVDPEALEEFLTKKDGSKRRLQDQTTRVTFYHTEDAIYRLWNFFGHCGLDMEEAEEKGTSPRQLMSETAGCQVIAHIKHTPSDDGTRIYANVSSTAPVE